MFILITGGAGSGKSAFAENLTLQLQNRNSGNLYYFATMQIYDEECRRRVLKHQRQRAGKNFVTIEMPFLEIPAVFQNISDSDTGLLECMSNLLANLQFDSERENQNLPKLIIRKILQLSAQLRNLVVITNEVFTDRMPDAPAMKEYIRNLGEINCKMAEYAEIVIEIQAGNPVIWKGENLFREIMG